MLSAFPAKAQHKAKTLSAETAKNTTSVQCKAVFSLPTGLEPKESLTHAESAPERGCQFLFLAATCCAALGEPHFSYGDPQLGWWTPRDLVHVPSHGSQPIGLEVPGLWPLIPLQLKNERSVGRGCLIAKPSIC